MFEATRPPILECRDTLKSYMIAYSLLQALSRMNPESVIEVVFRNEKGLLQDLSAWCEATRNELISSEESQDGKDIRALIQKGSEEVELEHDQDHERGRRSSDIAGGHSVSADTAVTEGTTTTTTTTGQGEKKKKKEKKTMTLLISTSNLASLITPLDRALSAIMLSSYHLNIIFESSGVRLLSRDFHPTIPGMISRLLSRTTKLESRLAAQGSPLPSQALSILAELGAGFYVDGPSLRGVGEEEWVVTSKKVEVGSGMMWVEMMGRSDVVVCA